MSQECKKEAKESSSTKTIHLVVYDLSNGMARTLSAQFLGENHTIDMIPHTGVRIYGKEYSYGRENGITVQDVQQDDHNEDVSSTSMRPVQMLPIENVSASLPSFEEVETWLTSPEIQEKFTARAYDLFDHNCNHFSQHFLLKGLGLPTGLPQWILDVPKTVLGSPMGPLVRQVLESSHLATPDGVPFKSTTGDEKNRKRSESADTERNTGDDKLSNTEENDDKELDPTVNKTEHLSPGSRKRQRTA